MRIHGRRAATVAHLVIASWSDVPKARVRLNVMRGLSFRCWFFGHEDWVRCAPGRLYLECIECGRETPGWRIGRSNRVCGGASIVEAPRRSSADPYRSATKECAPREGQMAHPDDITMAA